MEPRTDGRAGPARTAYQRLAARLRDEILTGELQPGDQLPTEGELLAAYAVSRSTAREALRSLEGLGLVVVKRGVTGGAFVAVPRPDHVRESLHVGLALLSRTSELDVADLVEIREILEVPGAELAALRRTDADLEAIRATLFTADQLTDRVRGARSQQFHLAVQRAAHNPILEMLIPVAYVAQEQVERARDGHFWRQIDHDHREILGYLEAGDQGGGREAMRAHLRRVRPAYERVSNEGLPAKTS